MNWQGYLVCAGCAVAVGRWLKVHIWGPKLIRGGRRVSRFVSPKGSSWNVR